MLHSRPRLAGALALSLFSSACVKLTPQPAVVPPVAEPRTALEAGLRPGPALRELQVSDADAQAALRSFAESCPKLLLRSDASGLSNGSDWRMACDAAPGAQPGEARQFFETHFETLQVGAGTAFATGYFEPQIAGVRTRRTGYEVPVYAMPKDLVRAQDGDAQPIADGKMPLGRYDVAGKFTPYYTRTEIEAGALAGQGLEIAWAADAVEFFFLQVQGSGRLEGPDGVIRIGYAGQNGHPYTGIGGVMRERGLLGEGPGKYPGSMQGIMQYLRENPKEGQALMRENASWVFLRELTGEGPLGALSVPVRRESSVAVDPKFVPLGAPVWLDLDRNEGDGLWIAQDTGGAIKGANRFDTFWGAGEDARRIAGDFQGRGEALLLLPKGTLKRLGAK